METFSFSIPQHVIFGKGSLGKLPEAAKALGKNKALIISGPHLNRIGMVDKCRAALSAAGIGSAAFTETEGNPSTETVEKAVEAYKSSGADFIVAFGGGSPLDVAKAAGILATYGGKITEYEGGGKVPGPVVPMIAIPTTAGTGSEVTSFSVITDHSRNYKLSVSSNYLLPAYAILDPELIASVPAGTAAAEAMMMGSLFAGIAFSHARLGDVHAMSHPVSAYFNVAHGVANAILLPVIVEYNELADQGKYYDIYRCVAKAPLPEAMFSSHMLTEELRALNMELGIPSCLKEAGVKAEYFDAMAEDAMKSGNISVNPRSTTKADVLELYKKAF